MNENNAARLCQTPGGEICHRFSPQGQDGTICLRCGHVEACHVVFSADGRVWCVSLRDDKTAATCREKFNNLTGKDFVLPPTVVEHYEHHWKRIVGVNIPSALERVKIERTRHEVQLIPGSVCSCVCGCVKLREPGRFVCADCWAEIKPRAHAERFSPEDRNPMRDEACRLRALHDVDVLLKLRADLYRAFRQLESDKDLHGFTLARVLVRPGEFRDVVRFAQEQENLPKMESGQVGAIWINAEVAMIPVFEHPFMPKTITTKDEQRRVICMLQYERVERREMFSYGWKRDESPTLVNTRFRIVTE